MAAVAEKMGLIAYMVDATELPTLLIPTKSRNLPTQGPDNPASMKKNTDTVAKRSIGMQKKMIRAQAKDEIMLITPPAKEFPLFSPIRAKTMETAYKNADKIAKAAAKLVSCDTRVHVGYFVI